MAKGLEKFQARERRLSLFGKDLTRRSSSCCELCGIAGQKLKIYELEPVPKDPEFDRCLFLCLECSEALKDTRSFVIDRWRFLSETIWSEHQIVQVLAARILEKIGRTDLWAAELLDEVSLDEETDALFREKLL